MAGDGRHRREPEPALRLLLPLLAAVALSLAALAAPASARGTGDAAEAGTPANRHMTLAFPHRAAEVAGPGALVKVRCRGSSAARCVGTLSLSVAGSVHKAPYSISKGRRQYVIVPLGEDTEPIDSLHGARATAVASTIQGDGAAVLSRRTLRLN